MKRFFYSACFVLMVSWLTPGQTSAGGPMVEVFGGYANGLNSQGWNVSVAGNVNKWFGVVADFAKQSSNVVEQDFQEKIKSKTYLFGPKFSFGHRRLTPFVRVLAGAATVKTNAMESGQTFLFSENSFAWSVGGGVDVRVHRRLAIRAFQLDYTRTKFFGESQHNGRLSFGLVYRAGARR